jgi:hypothetical protein
MNTNESQSINWQQSLNWLLDPTDPGNRYLALRDLLKLSPDDPELITARQRAHTLGPIAAILDKINPEGYWENPGAGYNPKYRSTVWSLILLAQLGARIEQDPHLAVACEYLLEHSLAEGGQFTTTGAPSGTVDCLHGNLCWALIELGCSDLRLEKAIDWLVRSVTGEGIAPKEDRQANLSFYAYKCGPGFACGVNESQACAWGAVKVVLALLKLPEASRTPLSQHALQQGIDFLLSVDPSTAAYPSGSNPKPSQSWWKFGFPVFYVSDILQVAEALTIAGYARDVRLANTLDLIRQKQNAQGQWLLEYDYTGKTWAKFGEKKQPNKWVTLRAMRVLKAFQEG